MSNKTLMLPDRLYRYLLDVSLRESELLRQLREETAKDSMARMQIAPEQGQFMALLVDLLGARRVLEIGVYTGYSALCMASALPPDGRLVACDMSEEWTRIARHYWHTAGLADRIDLHLAPALDTLAALLAEGQGESFDFAFIDADKREYQDYFEETLKLLRVGGLIAIDNTLWNGSVVDPDDQSEDTIAIRAFNECLYYDDRVSLSLVPIGDGLTLARKR
ncbi:MAG: class I SAM-dependent methyltransferase [Gammaproteobacteria bacterium]|jgi:caffeoyl-CoA O-methyltransferase